MVLVGFEHLCWELSVLMGGQWLLCMCLAENIRCAEDTYSNYEEMWVVVALVEGVCSMHDAQWIVDGEVVIEEDYGRSVLEVLEDILSPPRFNEALLWMG